MQQRTWQATRKYSSKHIFLFAFKFLWDQPTKCVRAIFMDKQQMEN